MKRRDFGTLAWAVSQIIDELGIDECMRVVGRSRSLLYKWCDPDQMVMPSLEQAFALDLAFVRVNGGDPPILSTYVGWLQAALEKTPSVVDPDIVRSTLLIQMLVGALAGKVREHSIIDLTRTNVAAAAKLREIVDVLVELQTEVGGLRGRIGKINGAPNHRRNGIRPSRARRRIRH